MQNSPLAALAPPFLFDSSKSSPECLGYWTPEICSMQSVWLPGKPMKNTKITRKDLLSEVMESFKRLTEAFDIADTSRCNDHETIEDFKYHCGYNHAQAVTAYENAINYEFNF